MPDTYVPSGHLGALGGGGYGIPQQQSGGFMSSMGGGGSGGGGNAMGGGAPWLGGGGGEVDGSIAAGVAAGNFSPIGPVWPQLLSSSSNLK